VINVADCFDTSINQSTSSEQFNLKILVQLPKSRKVHHAQEDNVRIIEEKQLTKGFLQESEDCIRFTQHEVIQSCWHRIRW